MNGEAPGEAGTSLLGEAERDMLESFVHGDEVQCDAILEYLGSFISHGVSEGRFTERRAHHDLEISLWVAYACINAGDYEHAYTACEWLSGVEDLARGCGVWYYRYANALMYCGRPGMALEYCERGASEDPDYPWVWLTLGRLRSHFGDRRGATEAAMAGLRLVPGDYEFLTLLADIETGATIEQMEMHLIDPDADGEMAASGPGDPEYDSRRLYVSGIVCDREGLSALKERLGAEGWTPDHPYCTYLMDRNGGSVIVTLMMSEAQASKADPDSVAGVVESLDRMDAEARAMLSERAPEPLTLYGLSIGPWMNARLSYAGGGSDDVYTADFDEDLRLVDGRDGGPYAAILLLREPAWDPLAVTAALRDVWGIELSSPEVDEDSLIAGLDGHMVAVSLIRGPVPGNEAPDAASNNYMWPEGPEEVRGHTAHLIVALVNHGGDPVRCGLDFTKLVDACVRACRPVGIYQNETVYRPEFYMMETDSYRTRDVLPVLVMVWIGMYRTSGGVSAYTVGMHSYGREEMEVLDADDESYNVMNFLYDVIYHSMVTGTVFRDGDTFGFGPDQVLTVTRSSGVSLDGYTLKLQYPGRGDRPDDIA